MRPRKTNDPYGADVRLARLVDTYPLVGCHGDALECHRQAVEAFRLAHAQGTADRAVGRVAELSATERDRDD